MSPIDKLKMLIMVAKCPACDGSGTIVYSQTPDGFVDEIGPCQWCDERKQGLIALSSLLSQREKLGAWLRSDETEHHYSCDKIAGEYDGYTVDHKQPCTCGLDELRSILEQK